MKFVEQRKWNEITIEKCLPTKDLGDFDRILGGRLLFAGTAHDIIHNVCIDVR